MTDETKPTNRPTLRVMVLQFDAVEIVVPPVLRKEQIPLLIAQLQNAHAHLRLREEEATRANLRSSRGLAELDRLSYVEKR
jgi:hypothetical protein